MKVRDIMTARVVSCASDLDVAAAARMMSQGRFGTLPVIDAHGTLVGIVTDRDIAMAVATRDRSASNIRVQEAMTAHPRRCFADDDVIAVLKQMAEARVRRLPVINVTGRLAGLVSIDDIVQRALDRPGGVSSPVFVQAMMEICSPPAEPDTDRPQSRSEG